MGYYLATGNALATNVIYCVNYNGEITGNDISTMREGVHVQGIRPVVCLKSDVGFEYVDGEWILE